MISFGESEDWAAEFAESTVFSLLPDGVKERAPAVCAGFLRRAGEGTESAARRVLLEVMPTLDLPAETREAVPVIVGTFLEWLQDTGRLGEGRSLARFIGALAPAYKERCSPQGGIRIPPVVKKTPDIGRNDPCPCGSGRKYKKCCSK
jgi:SEC-C motif-containing protein